MLSYIERKSKSWKIRPIEYSDESNILLTRIFDKMTEGAADWAEKRGHIELISIPLSDACGGRHYSGIPVKIRDEIDDTFGHAYKAKFSIGERHIEVFFSSFAGISKPVLRTYLKKVYIWFYMACGFAAVNACSRTLKLYVYMTKQEKRFPEGGEVLGIPHVNAGFTYSCAPSNEIHVYRAEEWFKVVIHETFHSLHLDFSSMSENIANPIIYDMIPVKVDLRFYEVYTDIWGDIIHTAFISGGGGSLARFKKNMNIERTFAVYQCARVLHHYGLSYMDLLDRHSNGSYKENSPILSYYIIKSCFHYFMNDFLQWCAIANRGSIQFRHTEGTIKSFCELYRGLYRDESYMTSLDLVSNVLDKRVPKEMGDTLRRTILE